MRSSIPPGSEPGYGFGGLYIHLLEWCERRLHGGDPFPIDGQFGPQVGESVQYQRGLHTGVEAACAASDELEWWPHEDGRVTLRNTKHDVSVKANTLKRAVYRLERDVRYERQNKRIGEATPD